MNGSYIIIKPEGENEREEFNQAMPLEKAQDIVGGYVERVPLFTKYGTEKCVVLCDEEGKIKNYDVNNRATIEWYKTLGQSVDDVLVGNVLVLFGEAAKGWH